ncbi:hypothetical protein NIES4074_48510 [Cylindrospermum sp. NIES-4074]|nr:hypothetical protein NIES4074_48510 [Cylindrospermum sp. NIES-4074]
MSNIHKLINQLAAQENELASTHFLAPCVRGGKVRTRIAGMVHTFTHSPRNFEGWGLFQPINQKTATLVAEPSLPQIAEYLQNLQPLRLRLVHKLQRQTWLAYPVNEADMQQRFGRVQPVTVHLTTEGGRFEPIIARTDGAAWWFDEVDRRADPLITEQLKTQFQQITPSAALHFSGMTPEMRTVYDLAGQQTTEFSALQQQRRDEMRLRQALQMGGGELQGFRERSDSWLVEWTTTDGIRHTSAISKTDLTVISAGICLSGEDEKFDLQSLVGVVEKRDDF